ncbi:MULTISPECIES: tetratricopeptide repeat protein [unclassified Simplicispira]|uniref:tetratricopeptide repeat protein n=1 Tax=unclassified Simplicispira TaxID=2630407 RepID=UPI000E2789A3|nr:MULTISPECIES: tetratricopeptide repeat protein [unclassified Simplicispira]
MKKINDGQSDGPYELALAAASSSQPKLEAARSLLEEAHQNGDPRATYALATWCLFGHGGFELDLKRAVALLKEASKADIPSAHFDLAVCYEKGSGVRRNNKLAYRHFLAASLYGDNDAYGEVGRCLYYGIGIDRDRKAAKIWLRRARMMGVNIR